MLRKIKLHSGYPKAHLAKELFLCVLSAILLALSFSNFNLWFLAWFGFVPLFFAIGNKPRVRVFLLSFLSGVIFWLGTIYWLIHITLPGTIILILYLALCFGVFGLFFSIYERRAKSYALLFIPAAWVLLEYVRSCLFTGFPWALLAYSQYLNLPIIQIADITGAWGVSFLVMMVNVFIYSVMRYAYGVLRRTQAISISYDYFLLPLLILVSLIYGLYRLHNTQYTIHNTLKISVIQGNIPQALKWDPESKDYIIDKYLDITRKAARDRPDLIIWPEAALPVVLEEEPMFFYRVKELVKEIKIPLLLGAVTQRSNLYYNSALLISGESQISARYDKLHLVPFGEYIPLKEVFPFLETVVPIGDITAGKEYTVFLQEVNTDGGDKTVRFSVLICFEDLFPDLSREFIIRRADFLVNITNDAWYKLTQAPYQHFQASVFRAVENRVTLVRCANTGVSGFIGPNGKIISLVQDESGRDIFVDGYNTQEIRISKKAFSFYTRYGDFLIVGCLLFVLYGMIFFPYFKKKQ